MDRKTIAWASLAALFAGPTVAATASCLPDSVTGSWQVTSHKKWISCLGHRCKHGNATGESEIDYLSDPLELLDTVAVQCWPSTSGLWYQGIGPFVSWTDNGSRCTASVVNREAFVAQLQSCAEDSTLAFLDLAGSVQTKRGGRKFTTVASLKFTIDNSAGHVIVKTISRDRWRRSE